ncbi:LarC family nickel insertion protein [Rhizobium sp. BK251]|uniref:LarC family nickel insertion protein n=1 Tax=Rhizobium sp. BK251 TaxID=2512125 RepID=UPI00104948AD|nr:LarC family nickel insertion protein [Rhizobium sp. BK251]TCL71201.1 hypothetical protein EV286_106174 [Rhizobium sp. BK251]
MTEIHLDPLGGIAGDMFAAAILDLRPDLEAGLIRVIALCPLPDGVSCRLVSHDDGVLTGRRFIVERAGHEDDRAEGNTARAHHHHGHDHDHHHHDDSHDHGHDHGHDHAAWREIRASLENASLPSAVIAHAVGIFALLAEAEAKVHGTSPEEVSFHEVGAWDSIADIVAAAFLIDRIGATHWSVGPIPLGSGRVRTAHGLLPVPAPATALLLEGFGTIDDGIAGERVTPTGAAILRYLCRDRPGTAPKPRRLVASGHGFGTRKMPSISNCLRVLLFEEAVDVSPTQGEVAVIEFEIDDQTGEDLAQAIDHLRAARDVLDVLQAPVFGKKGRMMAHVRILARPQALEAVTALVFEETTTIGLRYSFAQRRMLAREAGEAEMGERRVRLKSVERPGGRTTKAEADDLSGVAGHAARERLRRQAEKAGNESGGET